MKFIKFLKKNIIKFPPNIRFATLIFIDTLLIFSSFQIASYINFLRFDNFEQNFYLYFFLTILIVFVYLLTGKYKNLSRSIGSKFLYSQIKLNSIISIFVFLFTYLIDIYKFDFNFFIIFWYFLNSLTITIIFIIKDTLLSFSKKNQYGNVIIYGAGVAGSKLLEALNYSDIYNVKYFIDDNKNLWGRKINGIQVIPPIDIKKIITNIDSILIAMPELKSIRLKAILYQLEQFNVKVLQTPSIHSLRSKNISIDSLRPIQVEDLIERRSLRINNNDLRESITGNNICITGAGGSIGKELVKQIISLSPKNLYLIESNENNLYNLMNEICDLNIKNIKVKFSLLNCLDKKSLDYFFSNNIVNIIFHAAAYKHVPIVEDNPLAGIKNNSFSTKYICELALEKNVDKLILISTDKAVRPTNVMGASKRAAEIIIQLFNSKSKKEKRKTLFSIVRFGNVLNSSGSVVPLFSKQIQLGGPITLTHPDIERFFMTIPEATKLVLQASKMAKGGEVFLLDMGDPVKIFDLAKRMIKLSGLTIKDIKNPKGDIEIIITGLRPGEKLYEELLIDGKSSSTSHPLIFKSDEKLLDFEATWLKINDLENELRKQNLKESLQILGKLVPEWKKS